MLTFLVSTHETIHDFDNLFKKIANGSVILCLNSWIYHALCFFHPSVVTIAFSIHPAFPLFHLLFLPDIIILMLLKSEANYLFYFPDMIYPMPNR